MSSFDNLFVGGNTGNVGGISDTDDVSAGSGNLANLGMVYANTGNTNAAFGLTPSNTYSVSAVIDVMPSQVLGGSVVVKKVSAQGDVSTLVLNVDYYINEAEGTVELSAPLVTGEQIVIERSTSREDFSDTFADFGYAPAAATKNRDLQLLYIIQELEDKLAALTARIEALEP